MITVALLTGCVSTRPIPESGLDFQLDRCTPFLNCVSSESIVPLYKVDAIQLADVVDLVSWQQIRVAALELQGAQLKDERFGYLYIVSKSAGVGFPDYFEVLLEPNQQSLAVRSQSLLGLYDMGVNRNRVQDFKNKLQALNLVQ
jgi:uncharacterized protein (DUF1499 family)